MLIVTIFIFILGAIFGSFFNVCIYRIPRKESIVLPSSHCPVCNTKIKPIHNIPLLSYIFLKGKCHYCGAKIPIRYFFVELFTALLFMFAFMHNNYLINWILLKNLVFISFSIMIFYIDFDHGIIPDVFTYPMMILGLVFSYFKVGISLTHSIIGGFGIFSLLLILAYLCEVIKKRACVGGGDLKYLAAIGFFYGILASFLIIFFASVFALIYVIIIKHNVKKSFPFGPFLAISSLVYLFFGKFIINFYLQYFIGYNLY